MVLVLKAGQILACPNRNEQKEKKKNDSVCVDFANSVFCIKLPFFVRTFEQKHYLFTK